MSESGFPIFISAGDPSGDIAGSLLIRQLRQKKSDISFFGLGGKQMSALNQRQLTDGRKLAVLGFWEVAKKYFFFKKLMTRTAIEIEKSRPKAIILIDYPGFNLRLAQKIKRLRIPIIYYISPQIWAWHSGRIKKIGELIDVMLLILPFEAKIFDVAGIKNRFIGHYLFDDIEQKYITSPYNPESNQILLMPGSRPQEVQRMLPTMIEAAERLNKDKSWKFVVAAVDGDIDYKSHLKKSRLSIEVITGKTRELIADSRLVITSSGTATLEAAIVGRPMIVIYKTGWLTYQIARRLVKLDMIALINIIGRRKIVPEFVQHEASVENIVTASRQFLDDRDFSMKIVEELNRVSKTLGGAGSSARAAEAILELINC